MSENLSQDQDLWSLWLNFSTLPTSSSEPAINLPATGDTSIAFADFPFVSLSQLLDVPDITTASTGLWDSLLQEPFPIDLSFDSFSQQPSILPDTLDYTLYTEPPLMSPLPTGLSSLPLPTPASTPSASANSSSTITQSQSTSHSPSPSASPLPATKTSGRKRSSDHEEPTQTAKRLRNNAAAAKYRQKKLDRIAELEAALAETSKERDDLKLELAKRDAEVELLKRLLSEKGVSLGT